jgi:hypothetical protein
MVAKKRCGYCGRLFVPDRRVGDRQKACSAQCRKLRKKDNNRAFSRNNHGYWCGRYNELKQWRRQHPDYQKLWRQKRKQKQASILSHEIQAEIFTKALDSVEKNLILLREIQAQIVLQALDTVARKAFSPCRR